MVGDGISMFFRRGWQVLQTLLNDIKNFCLTGVYTFIELLYPLLRGF